MQEPSTGAASNHGLQVRQSVLVAATLIEQYQLGLDRILEAWRNTDLGDVSTMRADVERSYVAIWEQLEVAARLSRSAGRAVTSYEAIRSTPGLEVHVAVADMTSHYLGTEDRGNQTYDMYMAKVTHNGRGVALARGAVAALQAAWPKLDWVVQDEPVADLRPGGIGRMIVGLAKLFGRRN